MVVIVVGKKHTLVALLSETISPFKKVKSIKELLRYEENSVLIHLWSLTRAITCAIKRGYVDSM